MEMRWKGDVVGGGDKRETNIESLIDCPFQWLIVCRVYCVDLAVDNSHAGF